MQSPDPDTSAYAELLEHVGSSVRLPEPVPEIEHPVNQRWATRAMAMTQALVAMAVAAARPRP